MSPPCLSGHATYQIHMSHFLEERSRPAQLRDMTAEAQQDEESSEASEALSMSPPFCDGTCYQQRSKPSINIASQSCLCAWMPPTFSEVDLEQGIGKDVADDRATKVVIKSMVAC